MSLGDILSPEDKAQVIVIQTERFGTKEIIFEEQEALILDYLKKKHGMPEETKKCPRCNKQYTGYPALSRKDNKTEICSQCGQREAMASYAIRNLQYD